MKMTVKTVMDLAGEGTALATAELNKAVSRSTDQGMAVSNVNGVGEGEGEGE
jgi:hypothetical protein